jgi:TetR/AcrR family transcriptional regulator, lmrAB and yxaGH operons repressor
MAKASDSKGKTLAAAAKLFRQQGYHGTALHDILAAGGSPRGSLYFHFPRGKEEIGEAALTLAGEAVRRAIALAAETSESAEVFLTRIARGMASDLEKSGYQEGCPIATTALETAAQSDVLGAATRTAFQKWEAEIKRGLERFGMTPEQAELVATTVLSQLEGALLLARTYRSLEPMHRAEQALKLLVRIEASE